MGCPASSLGRGKTAVGYLRRILPIQKSGALCLAFFQFSLIAYFLFHDLEGILVESANGACQVVRDVFECRAGCDAAFGIALGRIIYVVAGGAVVFAGEYAVGHLVPVDQLPVRFDEIRATVAVVDIVGVLPYVDRHDGLEAFGHGVAGIGFRDDLQFAVLVGCEPRPARAEKSGSGFGELFLEGFDRSEVAGDAIRQFLGIGF